MIVGIGTDLLDVRRIEKVYTQFGDKFVHRILSSVERTGLNAPPEKALLFLGKRFAAKEACAKAFGTGISGHLSWHDMVVTNEKNGKPVLTLSCKAEKFLAHRIFSHPRSEQGNFEIQLDLSLSDEYPYVQAFVIISYIHLEKRVSW